ncbi:RNA-directed DNA polymerase, eukaryota, reverse transcriptase zinc-binding domain protein [Tanacetum coccineum]
MEVFSPLVNRNIEESSEFGCHFGCKELKLSHMCFVDDLLVLCQGNKGFIEVVKKALEEVSQVFGLVPNLGKSIIFFGSIKERDKIDILQVMPFKSGKLPVRYLGVPLMAKKLGLNDCKVLVERVEIINDLDKLFKRFLWNVGDSTKRKARVAWKGWKTMLKIRDDIRVHVWVVICNGRKTSVWYDKWCKDGPLSSVISKRDIYEAILHDEARVADIINNGQWIWPDGWMDKYPFLANLDRTINLNESEDKDVVNELAGNSKGKCFGMVVNKLILAASVNFIWQEKESKIV